MRTLEEIAARIKMLREDIESAKKRHESMTEDGHFGAASSEYTVIACADSMIKMLEWAMEGPSPAPAAWQPIATAPKDGTEMDLWCINVRYPSKGNERITNCKWIHDDWGWCMIGGTGSFIRIQDRGLEATHWQPLPTPPQADGACECNGQGWVEVADAQVIDCSDCTGKSAEVTG